MSSFGIRLKRERERLGLSQTDFAELAGQRKQSQINYENEKRNPDVKYLAAIQKGGVDIIYLMTGKPTPAPKLPDRMIALLRASEKATASIEAIEGLDFPKFTDDFAIIPRFDAHLSAGEGVFNEDDQPTDYLAFTWDWMVQNSLKEETSFLVAIRGKSMEPTLTSGDLVLIDKNRRNIRSGKVYAFNDTDGGSKVKRLELVPEVAIIIRSDNSDFDPVYRKGSDMNTIAEGIIGEVVWSGHSWM